MPGEQIGCEQPGERRASPTPAFWRWPARPSFHGDRWLYPKWETLAELTAPCERSLWGRPHQIQPVLVETVFGDGQQIIGLEPINHRPNYYVVRVDSHWTLDNHDWDHPHPLSDHLDDIYLAIEDEFGNARWCKVCGEEEEDDEHDDEPDGGHAFEREDWPYADFGIGSSWFLLERLEEVEPARV
jgi:hypothetical protein